MFYLKRNLCVISKPDKSHPLLLNIKVGVFIYDEIYFSHLNNQAVVLFFFGFFYILSKKDIVIGFVYISPFRLSLIFSPADFYEF